MSAVGVLAALFVGYVVVGTGWQANNAQRTLRHALATATTRAPHVGGPVARLVAPSASLDTVVIEGTGASQLKQAPGHVPGSTNPGGPGNVLIVGHRVAAGGPFSHLGRLRRGDTIQLLAPWGRSRYRVASVGTRADGSIDVAGGGPPRLTLVTSGSSLDLAERLVVEARRVTAPNSAVPTPARQAPRLPGSDTTAPLLFLAAVVAALLACQVGRWLAVAWGRVRASLFVAPFVAIALVEVFTVAVRLLPATF
jgi:sortase A